MQLVNKVFGGSVSSGIEREDGQHIIKVDTSVTELNFKQSVAHSPLISQSLLVNLAEENLP